MTAEAASGVRPPAAVLWDMDGTLVDSEPVHLAAIEGALVRLGARPGPELHALLLGLSAREMHARCVERYAIRTSYGELCILKYAAYAELAARLAPRPGVWETFCALKRRGVRMAVVSNSDRIVLDVNIEALGLEEPELISVSRNDVREGKPHPEPFLRGAYLLRAEPRDCVVVEDSPVGAVAGLAAGMRVVCWPDPGTGVPLQFPPGVAVVASAEELERTILGGVV